MESLQFDPQSFRIALAKAGYRSVAEFARRATISENYGRLIANGLIPGATLRERLAKLLDVQPGELWRCSRETGHEA